MLEFIEVIEEFIKAIDLRTLAFIIVPVFIIYLAKYSLYAELICSCYIFFSIVNKQHLRWLYICFSNQDIIDARRRFPNF